MSATKSLRPVVALAIALTVLLGYSFISAWTAAPSNPPSSNATAPINTSSIYQAKLGDFGAVRMRAGEYCDAAGLNCLTTLDEDMGTVYKICSTFVGGNWRDTITVPSTWTNSDCADFMTATGAANYSMGCISNSKIFMNDDAYCDSASATVQPSGKFCSVVLSGGWRDTILVPSAWTSSQCDGYADIVGATSYSMGCITATGFVFGNTATCNSGGSSLATDTKICTAVVSGNWRDTINVPATWDAGQCLVFQSLTGASVSGLGCALQTGAVFGNSRPCS